MREMGLEFATQESLAQQELGRERLLELEAAFVRLSKQFPNVKSNFGGLVSGANSERRVVELSTEAQVCLALCRALEQPALSPETVSNIVGQKGKNCDLSGLVESHRIYVEVKAYADVFPYNPQGKARALTESGYHALKDAREEGTTERARATVLRSKLDGRQDGKPSNGVPEQFADGEINILMVSESSFSSRTDLAKACFGDHFLWRAIDQVNEPTVLPESNGLFSSVRWRKIAAVADVSKRADSVSLCWFINPNADVPIPSAVLNRLKEQFP